MFGTTHHTPLHHRADSDIARRSRLSGLTYLILYAIIFIFTPYSDDHPEIMLPAGSIILLLVFGRMRLIYRFDTIYTLKPERWRAYFTGYTLFLAITWGSLCAFAVHFYALEWTALLILLGTAGLSSGAITTLSINRHLILVFLSLLLLPAAATAAMAALQTRESIAITLVFGTYYSFMFGIAIRINEEYWHALRNTFLLDQHARELETSNQELESYSYSIAHDLRTPLRSIIGFSQIILEDAHDRLDENERSDLNRVVSAGKHMAELIDDILELSRIARKELDTSRIDLSQLASTHAQLLASQTPERLVTFHIEPDLHATGDSKLLGIILQNLLDNAWKFTANRDNAKISLRSKQVDNETVYSLCDNGIGFNMAYVEMLFKPFYRLHSETEFSGNGVGLATVKRIVLRHGGRIWGEGEVGKGTCIYFTLHP